VVELDQLHAIAIGVDDHAFASSAAHLIHRPGGDAAGSELLELGVEVSDHEREDAVAGLAWVRPEV
jgi:hypothetical protein